MRSSRSLSADRLSSDAVAVAEVEGLVSTAIDAAYPARRGDSHALPSLAYVGFRRTCPVCAGRLIGYGAEVTKRIVVTGASGNVGVALIRRLTSATGEYNVLALARNPPSSAVNVVGDGERACRVESGRRLPRRPRQPVPRRRRCRPPRLALPPQARPPGNVAGQRPWQRAHVPGSHRVAGAGARVRLFGRRLFAWAAHDGSTRRTGRRELANTCLPDRRIRAPEVLRRRLLDLFELSYDMRIVRQRSTFVFQRIAASSNDESLPAHLCPGGSLVCNRSCPYRVACASTR